MGFQGFGFKLWGLGFIKVLFNPIGFIKVLDVIR